MSEWKEVKLRDIADFNPESLSAKLNWKEINYLDTGNITKGSIDTLQYFSLEDDKVPSRAKRIVRKNDIVYSTVRPNQEHYGIIKEPVQNMIVSTGFTVIRANEDLCNSDFLYYFLTLPDNIDYLSNVAEDSTTAYPSITPDVIMDMDITLPLVSEQKAIAEVLSCLDDKIDFLNRQNRTLVGIAETYYKKWFVEDVNKEWKEARLGDILDLIESGSRPKGGIDPELKDGLPSIGAENINGLGNYDYSKTKFITEDFFKLMRRGIVKDYDVLIYKDGAYVGKKSMFGNGFPYTKCAINEHVFILRANSKADQIFLYFMLDEDELFQLNTNSAQPGLNQESLKSMEIILPPIELINKFSLMVKPLVDKIFLNSKEAKTLSELRETLLPKFISGEIRVKM